MLTRIKTDQEIQAMREGGRMLASVLELLTQKIAVGMTTKDLAVIAARELQALGGQPAFLGYYGFPDVLCVSINEEVVHGIPSKQRVVNVGDLVSLDFGVSYQGMITDAACSVVMPQVQAKDKKLIATTEQSLMAGIDQVKGGVHVGDISAAVQQVLQAAGYGIVREFVGHGVGHKLHEDPNIPNYGIKGTGPILKAGMTIAIEPMAMLGAEPVFVTNDGWTVKTRDGSRAAHYEHTVLITDTGAEILTAL